MIYPRMRRLFFEIYISSWSDFRSWVHQVDDQQDLEEHAEGVEDLEGLVL